MNQYKCIIVDDEDVDRLMVVSLVKKFPTLIISGIFSSSSSALKFLETEKIDVLFLDVDMPNMNGMELRKKLPEIPICVFITGHSEHAVKSFEIETLDFLVKPLRLERFEKTVQKIDAFMETQKKLGLFELNYSDAFFVLKEGNTQTKIKLIDIMYLEAMKDYTNLVTIDKKYCVWSNLGKVLQQETFKSFVRIHKSYAIQKEFVLSKKGDKLTLTNKVELPIGKSFKDNIIL